MPQATTSKTMTSISYLHFLLLISSSSYLAVYTQAAPSHKFNDQQFQTSLHELTIGNTKDGSGHIQIARNHAAQSRRRRDPEALLDWADSQARKMRRRHRGRDLKASGQGKTNRRSEDSMEGSPNIVKRQEIQQGYAELHNLFSDTEVRSLSFCFPDGLAR